jgi:hypothetical protein
MVAKYLEDYPAVDPESCELLGPTALVRGFISSSCNVMMRRVEQVVQGLMGILVILSLVYKRHRETPKRPWRIWLVVLI